MTFCLINFIRTHLNHLRSWKSKSKMSSATHFAPASAVPARWTSSQLSSLLLDPKESEKIAVIDVRDDGSFSSFTSFKENDLK